MTETSNNLGNNSNLHNLTRKSLVNALKTTADILEMLGDDNAFKAKAYQSAARSLEDLHIEFADLQAKNFSGISKVGKSIALELKNYAETGIFAPLAEASQQVPAGVLGLFKVRGLGPKKIRALWDAGFDSLSSLQTGAQDGSLAKIKGFGAKSAETILKAVEFALLSSQRVLLSAGLHACEALITALADFSPALSGDVRRGLETVRVARITVTGDAEEILARLANVVSDLSAVENKPVFAGHLQFVPVEVAYAPASARGALDLMMGGSTHYRETLRAQAVAKGYKLSGRGLQKEGVIIPTPSELDVMKTLDLPLRPAEYREREHDKIWQQLPAPAALIKVDDLKGMLHTHSLWSDGSSNIKIMAETAVQLGHHFLGTGDHSRAAHYANGLSLERLKDYLAEIRALQADGVPVIAGVEVDILEDGALDYPDEILAELDYVVASVHSLFTLDKIKQTERLIKAVSHPLITILAHPTGGILLRRSGYEVDLEAVLKACEDNKTVVEINANPQRLDLDWRVALAWRDRLLFAINTDAHVTHGLADSKYGVAIARKAGLKPEQIINTLSLPQLHNFIRKQREARP